MNDAKYLKYVQDLVELSLDELRSPALSKWRFGDPTLATVYLYKKESIIFMTIDLLTANFIADELLEWLKTVEGYEDHTRLSTSFTVYFRYEV